MATSVPAPPIDGGVDRVLFAELHRWCREGRLDGILDAIYYEDGALQCFSVKTIKGGQTLLHEAVDADQPDVVQLLLLHGVSPDLRGKNSQTPLHLAASKGYVLCVQVLLEGGANVTLTDDLGHTALSKAERSKKRDAVLHLLRSKGMETALNNKYNIISM